MQLLLDVRRQPHSHHALDIARPRPEPDAIEHMGHGDSVDVLRDAVPLRQKRASEKGEETEGQDEGHYAAAGGGRGVWHTTH